MTYISPTTGDRVGLSFIIPRTREELEAAPRDDAELGAHHLRHDGPLARLHERHARRLGAPPPITSRGSGRPEFAREHPPLLRVHPRERHRPDPLADQPAAQPQRLRHIQPAGRHRAARDPRDQPGLVVRGARVLATLGPISDEIAVYSPRLGQHTEDHSPFAVAFAIPCGTPGLRFLCRDSFDLGRSHFDHPLGSRFEEMDCVVFFDDVEVPWDRVFLYGDVDLLNGAAYATHYSAHSSHQGAAKNLAKCEFVLGLALLMTEALGNKHLPHTEDRIGELMLTTTLTRALIRAARGGCEARRVGRDVSRSGDHREHAQPVHDRLSADDRDPAVARFIELHDHAERGGLPRPAGRPHRAVPGDRHHLGARPHQLFRLAWDVAGSSFGSRQVLYERFFASDPLTRARALAAIYPKNEAMQRVMDFLQREDTP